MSRENEFDNTNVAKQGEVVQDVKYVDPFSSKVVTIVDGQRSEEDFTLEFDDSEVMSAEDRDVEAFVESIESEQAVEDAATIVAAKDAEYVDYATMDIPQATKDNHEDVAHYIAKLTNPTYYMDLLWFKDGGQYTASGGSTNKHLTLARYIKSVIGVCTSKYMDEVIRQITFIAEVADEKAIYPIQFNNGYLYKGNFIAGLFGKFTPYRIDIDYITNAQPVEAVDNFLNHLSSGDDDFRDLILEMMAHPLITDREVKGGIGKFFMLVGDGANGKGTILKVLSRILGAKNSTKLSIENFGDHRYINITQGALVNLGDDVQDKPLDEEVLKMVKNYATCDEITMRRLRAEARDVFLLTTLIFTSNHVLKALETGHAYKRRVVWLPFYNKPTVVINDLLSRLTTPAALEYWLMLMIEAHDRLYENGKLTDSAVVTTFNEEYHQHNNPATMFLEDIGPDRVIGKTSKEVYSMYEEWSDENGFHVMKAKDFKDTVLTTFDFQIKPKTVNGRTIRPYQDKTGNIYPQSTIDAMLKAANGPTSNQPFC